jgi:hypothetical protein
MNHTNQTAAIAAMAPNAAPPTTLPTMAPGLGPVLTVWVTVAAGCVEVDVGGPLLPVKRGRPAHATVSPLDVKYAVSVSVSLADVQKALVKPFSKRSVAQKGCSELVLEANVSHSGSCLPPSG